MPHSLHPHTTSRLRRVCTVVLAVLATALTAFVGYAVSDMATTAYVGYEVGLTRTVTIVAALLMLLSWTGVIVLHSSTRSRHRGSVR